MAVAGWKEAAAPHPPLDSLPVRWFNHTVAAVGDGVVKRRVEGAGVMLSVTERGDPDRPTVVLVHGFPDTQAVWEPVADLLAVDLHVVSYDVRGAGDSGTPVHRSDYALHLLVEDMAAVIDAVSPDEAVHLVAHDWGSIQGWEAVLSPRLTGRIASYTSISGPPLDYAALWARQHRGAGPTGLRAALRQALHSWYIAFFHIPVLPRLAARNTKLWSGALERLEGAEPDALWPAPTLADDFAHGVELYRANVLPRFRHPAAGHTDTPVQIIVPLRDRYLTPTLLEGLESWSSGAWRRQVDAGHWVIRTDPHNVAAWTRQLIDFVEQGTESPDLSRWRAGQDRVA